MSLSGAVIGKADRACINCGQNVDNHFNRSVKMAKDLANKPNKPKAPKKGAFVISYKES